MSCEPNPDIYSFLIEQLELSNQDRYLLKAKRGFTDQTIDALKFKSVCKDEKELIAKLESKFSRGDLVACGVMSKRELSWIFKKEGNIVIPYLDERKDCYFLKSHKNGNLKDAGVEPYCKMVMNAKDEMVVLCESEFKAAAMWQMGFKAIGLGGVSTFAGKSIEKLKDFLDPNRKVIILFDTEIQDNPDLPNYKDHFKKRYAQNIWSFILATRIRLMLDEKDKPKWDIRIATLPKEWVIDGKIDIDSAVATGKTRDDFLGVIGEALPANAYRREIEVDKKHRPWINRQMEAAYKDDIVYISNNCYWMKKKIGQGKNVEHIEKELSNFIIKLRNTLYKGSEVYREIILISKFGDVSPNFILTSEEMSSFSSFKKKCLSQGDFIWKGTDQEFNFIVEKIFLENDTVPIHLLEFVGRDESNQQWIFDKTIVKDDGKVINPCDDGVTFWDDDKGYRIVPLSSGLIPRITCEQTNIYEIFEKFEDAWGITGAMAFCYTIACLFSNEIFKEHKAFPFAMIYGEKESGKSTLSDAMVMLLGFTPHYTNMSISDSTQVGIGRTLSYYSSLPCRFDEYRKEERKIEEKSSFLRSAYNRQASIKGKRESFGIREVKISGTIIMIGEQKPDDPALLSRMIPLYLTPTKKTIKTYESVKWLYQNQEELSKVAFHFLKEYKKNIEKIMTDLNDTRIGLSQLSDIQSSFRVQFHYAIIIACLALFLTPEEIEKRIPLLREKFYETAKEQTEMSILSRFFCDLLTMKNMGEKVINYLSLAKDKSWEGLLYFPGLHNDWAKFRQQHGGIQKISDQMTLQEYLSSQAYCMSNAVRKRVPASQTSYVRCMKVDLKHPQISGYLKELFDGVSYYHGPSGLLDSGEEDET